ELTRYLRPSKQLGHRLHCAPVVSRWGLTRFCRGSIPEEGRQDTRLLNHSSKSPPLLHEVLTSRAVEEILFIGGKMGDELLTNNVRVLLPEGHTKDCRFGLL